MYQPKFSITHKILKNVGLIEACKEVIENAPLVPYYEKQFASEALARTVHHGTHIEGVGVDTLDQVRRILEGEEVVAHDRDIQEVINYRNVMKLLDDLSGKRGGYDIEDLKEIHKETVNKIIPAEKVGVFRKTQVVVKEEGSGRVILQPPPAVEVPFLLEDFFEWINSEEAKEFHPILRAGISHYILVAIHPFVEGNGRSVRAFANLILMKEGYNLKRFFSVEEHFDEDPASYYESFAQVDRQSPNIAARDLTPWLEYFTQVVAIELGKIKERVRKLSIDSKFKGKLGEQVALTERQMKLIEYLSENNSAGMQELKNFLSMVSEDTI
ncbi:Fic family protein [Patescibacteria group bacterium]|nr:Fic family protein [Patescibacteria group bacterium]